MFSSTASNTHEEDHFGGIKPTTMVVEATTSVPHINLSWQPILCTMHFLEQDQKRRRRCQYAVYLLLKADHSYNCYFLEKLLLRVSENVSAYHHSPSLLQNCMRFAGHLITGQSRQSTETDSLLWRNNLHEDTLVSNRRVNKRTVDVHNIHDALSIQKIYNQIFS